MIYEARSYRLKPMSIAGFLKEFGAAYEKRKEISPLAAFLYVEFGRLNEVIHIWPYENHAERDRLRTEAADAGVWPPKVDEFIGEKKSEIYTPLPIVGDFGSGKLGPLFEWREYTIHQGKMAGFLESWEGAIEERRKESPLVTAMQTEFGGLNKFVHLWGYESLEHRADVRSDSLRRGIWPPKDLPRDALQMQENRLCYAAPFSPLQ